MKVAKINTQLCFQHLSCVNIGDGVKHLFLNETRTYCSIQLLDFYCTILDVSVL